MARKKKVTIDVVDITAALKFLSRHYPALWAEVGERNMLRLVTVAYALFKANPEYLEASNYLNKTPTQ